MNSIYILRYDQSLIVLKCFRCNFFIPNRGCQLLGFEDYFDVKMFSRSQFSLRLKSQLQKLLFYYNILFIFIVIILI